MAKTKNAPESTGTRDEKLELALAAIKKKFGDGAILSSGEEYKGVARRSTGSPALDQITTGGYAQGRIIEVIGPESAGKTTLTLAAIAECQKAGGRCAFIDAEHALDQQYAESLGVDVDALIISQPDCGEDALNTAEILVRSSSVDLIVIDSVAALTPRAEIEKEIGDSVMGMQARMMSQALRKITGAAQTTNTTVIFINQIRMKIGVMFGSPEVGCGGEALKFYASQRLEIRRSGIIKDGDEPIGITSKVKVIKSKVGRPFKSVEIDILFGKGIDWAKDIINLAIEADIIKKSGAWFSYNDTQIGQGLNNACQYIKDNPEICNEIRGKLGL